MWIDDQILRECEKHLCLKVWIPDELVVVLGSSNKQETECLVNLCEKDQLKILRRYGGGGTVVLHPQCIIVSLGTWVKRPFENDLYFKAINQAIINTLAMKWPLMKDLHFAGISDIAYQNQKICGTSMFRSRNYLLYQASILIETEIEVIEKYLQHPSKEPDYRQGKKHRNFLTSLKNIDSQITCHQVNEHFKLHLQDQLKSLLADELIAPSQDQIKYLLRRAGE